MMKSFDGIVLSRRQAISMGLASIAAFGLSACSGGSASKAGVSNTVAPNSGTYGKPWITSIVDGMVTADLEKPDLKDDFYLNVNYEWLRDTVIPVNQDGAGGREDVLNIVNERIANLCTDESITGPEAAMVREYYEMHLDWDTRLRGKEFFLEHLKPIQNIASLEGLSAYLSSEESLYYGIGMLKDLVVDKHLERPEQWMLRIRITSLDFDGSGEYEEETPTSSFESDCASYMLQYAGYKEKEANKLVEQCYAFEKLLNSSIGAAEEAYTSNAKDAAKTFFNREELAAASPKFPLVAIIDSYGYNPELDINLQQPWWLEAINGCYTEDNVPLMRAYLLCHYASDHISSLDENCYRKSQQLKIAYGEMSEPRADEYYAVKDASFELSNFMDQMYVEKYCSEKMRQDIKDLVKEVVAEYQEMLRNETWLSKDTRDKAVRKLDALRLYAVYPNPDEREDWSGCHFISRADGGNYLMAY